MLTDTGLPALFSRGALLAVCFVPHLVAWNRGVRVATTIFIVGFFATRTLVGWAARLAWATAAGPRKERGGDETKTCPDSTEKVQVAARICRFCRHDYPALACQP